jgi:hypothetical protein
VVAKFVVGFLMQISALATLVGVGSKEAIRVNGAKPDLNPFTCYLTER